MVSRSRHPRTVSRHASGGADGKRDGAQGHCPSPLSDVRSTTPPSSPRSPHRLVVGISELDRPSVSASGALRRKGERPPSIAKGSDTRVSIPPYPIALSVNGTTHEVECDPRTSLLDLLRDTLDLTGTKKGCNQGGCGACTVIVDGERILSCLSLAVQNDGARVTTVEGLEHPLQDAFVRHDGLQCGYCTAGQLCSGRAMLDELARGIPSHVSPDVAAERFEPTAAEIQERMSGNLCRCGAYNGIVDALIEVADATPPPSGNHTAQEALA